MNNWVNYIIEVNLGIVLFFGGYKLLLCRESDFRFQRILLLTGLVASLIFPLIHLQPMQHASVLTVDKMIFLHFHQQGGAGVSTSDVVRETYPAFFRYACLVYIVGLLIGGVSMLFELVRLIRLIRHSETRRIGKFHIAESTEDKPAFSFFNFIFIGRAHTLSVHEKDQLIRHETVHARQMHSIDILFVSLLKRFFWFNPFITLYRRALVEAHEFEADARTVATADTAAYCSLLAKVALQGNGFSLASYFNHNLTLKRIAMIRSVKSKTALWKLALSAATIPLAFFLLSCQDQLKGAGEVSGQTFSEVDESAVPVGGAEAFYHNIVAQLRYPAKARAGHIYGRVAVQFFVNEDGHLSDFQLLESPDKILGDEVIRVLSLSPGWVPAKKSGVAVRQGFRLPITFKLDFPGKQEQAMGDQENEEDHMLPNGSFPELQELVVVGYALK